MTVHRNRFLVNKTNRCTEFLVYWYYDTTCFGQPFCPSSGVLNRTSALVHFTQLWRPFATRSRMAQSAILLTENSLVTARNEKKCFYKQDNLRVFGFSDCVTEINRSLDSILIPCTVNSLWIRPRDALNSNFYWYCDYTCFGQPFCPSSGVLSRTSALVHFTQLWRPFATRSRMELHSTSIL